MDWLSALMRCKQTSYLQNSRQFQRAKYLTIIAVEIPGCYCSCPHWCARTHSSYNTRTHLTLYNTWTAQLDTLYTNLNVQECAHCCHSARNLLSPSEFVTSYMIINNARSAPSQIHKYMHWPHKHKIWTLAGMAHHRLAMQLRTLSKCVSALSTHSWIYRCGILLRVCT